MKVPRSEIQNYGRDDLSKAGIYFLFGSDDGTNSVYIGESEDMLEGLRRHLKDYQTGIENFFWNCAVAFTSQDLSRESIRYIEDELMISAMECGRYRVFTKNKYGKTLLKESEKAVMTEFMDNMKLMISILGYNVFTPVLSETEIRQYFFCHKKSSRADAKGFVSPGGFTVLKGSRISDYVVPSMLSGNTAHYNELRLQLENDGIISGKIFQRNYEFSSPSAASTVVLGQSSNGKEDWKTEYGVKLKDI